MPESSRPDNPTGQPGSTSNPRHTPEPWNYDSGCGDTGGSYWDIYGPEGTHSDDHVSGENGVYLEEDCERIVDCVNACAGIVDPAAALDAARDVLREYVGDEAIEQVMYQGRQAWRITKLDGEWCIICSDWNDPPLEAKALAALERLK